MIALRSCFSVVLDGANVRARLLNWVRLVYGWDCIRLRNVPVSGNVMNQIIVLKADCLIEYFYII